MFWRVPHKPRTHSCCVCAVRYAQVRVANQLRLFRFAKVRLIHASIKQKSEIDLVGSAIILFSSLFLSLSLTAQIGLILFGFFCGFSMPWFWNSWIYVCLWPIFFFTNLFVIFKLLFGWSYTGLKIEESGECNQIIKKPHDFILLEVYACVCVCVCIVNA